MLNFVFPLSLPGVKINVRRAPQFDTIVQQGASGSELRAAQRSRPIWKYSLEPEFLRSAAQPTGAYKELESVLALVGGALGKFDSFLLSDPEDSVATMMGFGIGDGATTAFPLQRSQSIGALRYDALNTAGATQLSTPRINYIHWSTDLSHTADWIYGTARLGWVAPDGTPTGYFIFTTAPSQANHQDVAVPTNRRWTFSVWLLATSTSSIASFGMYGSILGTGQWLPMTFKVESGPGSIVQNGSPGPTSGYLDVSGLSQTVPTRVSCTLPTNYDGTGISCYVYPNGYSGAQNKELGQWGFQLEEGAVATPLIITAGSAGTAAPAYWPASGDGFEPVTEFALAPAIYVTDYQGTVQRSPFARTNLVVRSKEFDNASWQKTNGGAGSVPVVTADFALAPDGSVTADKVVYAAPGGADISALSQVATVVSAQPYAQGLWIKAAAAGDVGKVLGLRGVGSVAYTLVTLTANWQRVQSAEVSVSTSGTFEMTLRPSVGTSSGTVTALLWQAQMERGVALGADIETGFSTVTLTDYVLANGVATFNPAPKFNAPLLWSGPYYRRVRFDDDAIEFERFGVGYWLQKGLPLVSVLS